MPAETWELLFRQSLIERAKAVAALKEAHPDAEERAELYPYMLAAGLYCPECWVRYGEAVKLHTKRWHMSCGEHDYHFPKES